jgi:hypothetical protein
MLWSLREARGAISSTGAFIGSFFIPTRQPRRPRRRNRPPRMKLLIHSSRIRGSEFIQGNERSRKRAHPTLVCLTTCRFGDIASVTKKGCLKTQVDPALSGGRCRDCGGGARLAGTLRRSGSVLLAGKPARSWRLLRRTCRRRLPHHGHRLSHADAAEKFPERTAGDLANNTALSGRGERSCTTTPAWLYGSSRFVLRGEVSKEG